MWWLPSSVYVSKQLKDVLDYLMFVKKFFKKKNIYTVHYCATKFNNNTHKSKSLYCSWIWVKAQFIFRHNWLKNEIRLNIKLNNKD